MWIWWRCFSSAACCSGWVGSVFWVGRGHVLIGGVPSWGASGSMTFAALQRRCCCQCRIAAFVSALLVIALIRCTQELSCCASTSCITVPAHRNCIIAPALDLCARTVTRACGKCMCPVMPAHFRTLQLLTRWCPAGRLFTARPLFHYGKSLRLLAAHLFVLLIFPQPH